MSSNPVQTAPSPAPSGTGIETGAMVIEHGRDRLLALVERQLTNLFEYDPSADAGPLQAALEVTLNRVSHCFNRIVLKRYQQDGAARFSPFHSGQYCIFLYYLSHTLARQGASGLADRVYYLNRALNGVDLFHQVDLPEVFCVEHPLASVIGRAQIGDCFFFAQGVTVGGNKGAYPVIGRHVSMLSNSKVVGRSVIGDHVILSANCYVKDAEIPPHSIVFGQDRNLIIKNNPGGLSNDIFVNAQA